MDVQRKLEILADANLERGIHQKKLRWVLTVIACDKREAFAQGSEATKQSMPQQVEKWIASAFAKATADKSLRSQ